MGLFHAIKKFNQERGSRFGTCATDWIKEYLFRGVRNKGTTIRIPLHKYEQIIKLVEVQRKLTSELDRKALPQEIATKMGISLEKVSELQKFISLKNPPAEIINGTTEKGEHYRYIEIIEKKDLLQRLKENLNKDILTFREKRVLELRYGLEGKRTNTLKECAEKLGISRERVRQIEKEAIGKLQKYWGTI